jgi:hypothetical protein
MSPDPTVSTLIGYDADDYVYTPDRNYELFLSPSPADRLRGPPNPSSVSTQASSPGLKWLESETYYLHLSISAG